MKISEYIHKLHQIQVEHGDLEVESYSANFDRAPTRAPEVAYRRVLTGRESKPSFWAKGESEERRGEKVVRI